MEKIVIKCEFCKGEMRPETQKMKGVELHDTIINLSPGKKVKLMPDILPDVFYCPTCVDAIIGLVNRQIKFKIFTR